MKKELDDALCLDFPLLFRDRRGDKMKTCMVWGFCCGDYWEPFVRRIAEKLEPMIQKQIMVARLSLTVLLLRKLSLNSIPLDFIRITSPKSLPKLSKIYQQKLIRFAMNVVSSEMTNTRSIIAPGINYSEGGKRKTPRLPLRPTEAWLTYLM